MEFLAPHAHDSVLCPATIRLAEVLWHLLKAEQMLQARSHRVIKQGLLRRSEPTAFGEEVGRDAIHWWVFDKEDDLDRLRSGTTTALGAADRVKAAATTLRALQPKAYDDLLTALRQFAEAHSQDIQALLDYLLWLRRRDVLAPAILFTYRVWGSTRRGDRWIEVTADEPTLESQPTIQRLTELALGLRGSIGLAAFDRAILDVGSEIYERDPERAEEIEIPYYRVISRASWQVLDEFAIFFEWIRNSLRNVLLDIDKCRSHRALLSSDAFWKRFIRSAVRTQKRETQLWDFKETLTAWHATGTARTTAKTTFAEDVASFANADGGVLIIGVSDDREVMGIGSGDTIESRLKVAKDILAERLEYPRPIVTFHQVLLPHAAGGEAICLVVIVARTFQAVGASDGAGHYSYPIRRETGLSRGSRLDIDMAKIHAKSDDHDFMEKIEAFVRDNPA